MQNSVTYSLASLSVSADERKMRANSEKRASERKMTGREKGRSCKHLYKYHSPPIFRKIVSRINMTIKR